MSTTAHASLGLWRKRGKKWMDSIQTPANASGRMVSSELNGALL